MTSAFVRYRGQAFRAHHPAWAFAPTSGEGAGKHGGRFNPPGIQCLYLSCSFEGAWREAQQGFAFKTQPLTLCTYDIDCADIADLSTYEACRDHGIEPMDLAAPWERLMRLGSTVPTWAISKSLSADGCAGLIVPSYASRQRNEDRNLVLWNWSDKGPHRVTVIDDESRLPRDQSSWNVR